jgi:hypothetical protein
MALCPLWKHSTTNNASHVRRHGVHVHALREISDENPDYGRKLEDEL